MKNVRLSSGVLCGLLLFSGGAASAADEITYPPRLPGGRSVVSDRSPEMLRRPASIPAAVAVAKEPPQVDFLYFPGQDYPGNPWSSWGDSLAVEGKYYTSIGDHLGPEGNAFIYEYDPASKSLRRLLDLRILLKLPAGHYTPGKIHSRIDMGSDGRLYFATHRGSTRVTTDAYHYQGDWIVALDPKSGAAEVVARGPVSKHCIPTSVLDPERLIFYGGTTPGDAADPRGIRFFAYDVKGRRLLCEAAEGPARYLMFSHSTGRVWYAPGQEGMYGGAALMRFDPAAGGSPVPIATRLGVRAATEETPQGKIYVVSSGQGKDNEAEIFEFDVKSEKARKLGPAAVGGEKYIASIDVDPSGRYLYYVAGAHGGSERDGTPVVQFDVRTGTRKVLAFLHPYYESRYGLIPKGTYSTALAPEGDVLYITWNVSRGSRHWDCCGMTALHIPPGERQP